MPKIQVEKRGDTYKITAIINGQEYSEEYWLLTEQGAIQKFKDKYNL